MPGDVSFQHHDVLQSEILSSLEAGGVVTYTTDYAHHVEFLSTWDTTPPPFRPIRDWVGRKWPDLSAGLKEYALYPLDAQGNPDTSASPKFTPNSDDHMDAVAHIVRMSIFNKGQPGVHYGGRALNRGRDAAPAFAQQYANSNDPRASEKVVEDVLDYMFAESQRIIAQEASDTGNLLQSGMVSLLHAPHQASGEKEGDEGDISELPEPDASSDGGGA